MSADSASLYEPVRAIRERERRRREMQDRKYIKNGQRKETNIESGARHRIFRDGLVPWVRLESVIRCISQAVRSTSQDLVNYEGTFPLGLEFVLFLVQ